MPEYDKSDEQQVDLTLFVPCYNEEGNIVQTLETIKDTFEETPMRWEAIVIDDVSKDRSVELVEAYIAYNPDLPISLIINDSNCGLAYNFVEGAFMGTGKYYKIICGDNVQPKETLVNVFRHIGQADMILCYHAEIEGKARYRMFLSRAFTVLVNLAGGHKIKYYNGCSVYLRRDVMRWHSQSLGFGFQADFTTRLLDLGRSYIEVPMKTQERKEGKSKAITVFNFLSVGKTLIEILIRRTRQVVCGYPRGSTRNNSADS
jgi:glycosyltransferase involved in cell wall biosynthesis